MKTLKDTQICMLNNRQINKITQHSIIYEEDKMKPDGPCKMGLTDSCPWAEEKIGRAHV